LYLRGKIFWFSHGSGKNRLQVSLETSDEADAIQKATAILENPELNPCNGFLKEMNRYADEKVSDGTWTGNSRSSKLSILKMFGDDLGFKDLPDITTEEIETWYARQKKRVEYHSMLRYGGTQPPSENEIRHKFPTSKHKRSLLRPYQTGPKLHTCM
jgi:hypothetical protein